MGRRAGESVGDWFRHAAANDDEYGYDNPANPNNRKDGVIVDDGREAWETGVDASRGGR